MRRTRAADAQVARSRTGIALRLATTVVALLALVELTFRLFWFGAASLSVARMDSATHIWSSGFVRPARHPEIFYELKPNQRGYFRLARFATNSDGLADDEYALAKPANTFRVAVIGSSWTMASGVSLEQAYHSRLEAHLNGNATGRKYEFINFGVEHYGLGEMLATLRHRALAYHPDLILFELTGYTPWVLWPEVPRPFAPLPREHAFFALHTLRYLNWRFGLGLRQVRGDMRELVADEAGYRAQLARALDGLADLRRSTGTPVAIVWLGYERWLREVDDLLVGRTGELGLELVDTSTAFAGSGLGPDDLRTCRADNHPNALAHRLFARRILEVLLERGLLAPGR